MERDPRDVEDDAYHAGHFGATPNDVLLEEAWLERERAEAFYDFVFIPRVVPRKTWLREAA